MWFKKIFQIRTEPESFKVLEKRLNSMEIELDRIRMQNRKLSFTVQILMESQLGNETGVSHEFPPVRRVS